MPLWHCSTPFAFSGLDSLIVPTDTTLMNKETFNGNVYNEMKFDVGNIGASL